MIGDDTVPQVELEIVRGQARQKRRPVEVPAFLVGASRDCDLVLAARQFPDVFAYLIVHEEGVLVRHLGVAPDLLVNGQCVTDAQLSDGDRLSAGPYEFVIHVAQHQGANGPNATPCRHSPTPCWTDAKHATGIEPLLAAMRLVKDIRAALNAPREAVRRSA